MDLGFDILDGGSFEEVEGFRGAPGEIHRMRAGPKQSEPNAGQLTHPAGLVKIVRLLDPERRKPIRGP